MSIKKDYAEKTYALSSRSAGNPLATWERQFQVSERQSPVTSRKPGIPEIPVLPELR